MAGDSLLISFAGAPEQIRNLASWLRDEGELRGRLHLVERANEDGHMGGIADALCIAVGSGGVATVSMRSLLTWLSIRHRAVHTKIELKAEDGREAHIELSDSIEAEAILDTVAKFFQGGEP